MFVSRTKLDATLPSGTRREWFLKTNLSARFSSELMVAEESQPETGGFSRSSCHQSDEWTQTRMFNHSTTVRTKMMMMKITTTLFSSPSYNPLSNSSNVARQDEDREDLRPTHDGAESPPPPEADKAGSPPPPAVDSARPRRNTRPPVWYPDYDVSTLKTILLDASDNLKYKLEVILASFR